MLRRWLGRPGTDASWFTPISESLDWLAGGPPRTIWCIANSDAVPVADVLAGIAADDALAFYNKCQYAADFAGRDIPSLCFFHASDHMGLIHGIGPDGRPGTDLSGFPPPSRAIVLRPVDVPPGERTLTTGFPTIEIETGRLQNLFFRPRQGVSPSAGFASVLLFEVINRQRALAGSEPHRIVLCGFSGSYDGAGYMGHDFHAEQAAYRRLPNVEFLGGAPEPAETRLHHDLADVFHPTYNGHTRPKAGMLFDVARLAFAAGDIPGFVRLVRQSLAVNPNFVATRWLIRALDTQRAQGREAPGLDGLLADLDILKTRWVASADRSGLGGAEHRADVDHPQAQYAVPDGTRPSVLILNETSKMPFNRWHLGCDLVSRNLVARLDAHGIDVAGWANSLTGVSRILAHDPHARFAGVVVNGEGTMHDNADRAYELLTMARQLRRMGKKVFLINSVWETMGPWMEAFLGDFEIVTLRESVSREAVRHVRADARVVPDLCWLADLPPTPDAAPCGVIDCVVPESTLRLEAAAAAAAPFFVMDRFYEAFHRTITEGGAAADSPRILRPGDIRGASRWIGGRFHGTVLALASGMPMLSLPSNTAKIEATLGDIGLADKMLDPARLDGASTPDDLVGLFSGSRDFSAADWRKVAEYRATAAREIDATFADIAAALG